MTHDLKKKAAIGSRLKTAREEAGLSQGQLAKMMDMHRPTISEIEAGRRNVTSDELAKLAEIFGVNLSWLACVDTDEPDPAQDKVELAARELQKLKPEDLDKVMNLIKAIKSTDR